MDDKEVKELMAIGKKLDFNLLKDAVREMNDAIEQYNADDDDRPDIAKIRVVGLKKPNMFLQWVEAVHTMNDNEFDGLPASSVGFYNEHVNPAEEEVEEVEEEEVEEASPVKDTKKKDTKKKDGEKKAPKIKKITTFEDIKEALKNPSAPTPYFDSITLKGGSIEAMLAKFKQWVDETNSGFKSLNTISSIKAHITYRQTKGWIYEEEKGKIKLVGYDPS